MTSNPRIISFFLTQFHPTAENDKWWGRGFTEWTNVTKAAPLYEGHYQPHLPSDLGFYDLRLQETRQDQIALAKEYGIDGFCYHYYWFSGKRILNKPLDSMFEDKENSFPYCLCWANENWTRRWDAADHEILIAQEYLPDDNLNFIKSLIPHFKDNRYIKVDGKPLLIVYRPQHLPNAKESAEVWRAYCRNEGLGEIHICSALTHGNEDYLQFGFDSGVEFPPHNLKTACQNQAYKYGVNASFTGRIFSFSDVANNFLEKNYKGSRVFKTVFPSWDNSARTGSRALIIKDGNPNNYEFWLSKTFEHISKSQDEDPIVFVNAWNEWAEGCHLEPDRKYGRKFLEATLRVKQNKSQVLGFVADSISPSSFIEDLIQLVKRHVGLIKRRLKIELNKFPEIKKILKRIISPSELKKRN